MVRPFVRIASINFARVAACVAAVNGNSCRSNVAPNKACTLVIGRQGRGRDPMRREHGQARIFERGQQHQHAVERLEAGRCPGLLPAELLIVQGGFVAMVAVCNEQRLAAQGVDGLL